MTLTAVELFSEKDNSQQFVKAVQPIFGQERLFLCPDKKSHNKACHNAHEKKSVKSVFAGVDKIAD